MKNKTLFFFLFFYTLTFFLLLVFMDNIYAITAADAKVHAEILGNHSSFNPISNNNKNSVPGYVTDSPSEIKYYNGANMDEDAVNKIENSQEGRLISHDLAKRPKIEVDLKDSFLSKSNDIEDNSDQVMRMMTGSYDQCKPITEDVIENFEIKTCDKYQERTASSCLVGNIVDITKGNSYRCNIKRVVKEKNCDKNLELQCNNYSLCSRDMGFASLSGQYSSYSYPYFNINIPVVSGGCTVYQREVNIFVKDPKLVDSFVASGVEWDDSVEILINGHSIYRNWYGCERAIHNRARPNKEMKQYLVRGNNKLVVKLLVTGLGFVSSSFILRQKCCVSWQEQWEEVCRN